MPTYIREAELTYRRRKTPRDPSDPAFTTVRFSSDIATLATVSVVPKHWPLFARAYGLHRRGYLR